MVLHAIYDFNYCPESFDFFIFLGIVTNLDENVKVVFIEGKKSNGKFNEDQARRRRESILIPGCDILGIPYELRSERNFDYINIFPRAGQKANGENTYWINGLFDLYRSNGIIKKFSFQQQLDINASGSSPEGGVLTITLRNQERNSYRNSNLIAWKQFAEYARKEGYKVIVIDDYTRQKISLSERIRLYSSATMNLFVSNGPAVLCELSELPYMVFKMISRGPASVEHLTKIGMPPGFQFPWRSENQRLVWADDSFENIVAHFDTWRECWKGKLETKHLSPA